MFYEVWDDHVLIRVKAVPGSSINKIVDATEEYLRIKIKAPAVEGAANAELVKFLAKSLRVSKSDIRIVRGDTSKIKTLRIAGCNLNPGQLAPTVTAV